MVGLFAPRLDVDYATASHIGGRDQQEDAVGAFRGSDGSLLLVVADGMGGHGGGAMASRAVIDTAKEAFESQKAMSPDKLLRWICETAHQRVNEIGRRTGKTPRSTVVLLHLGAEHAHWAHIGDSRLYLFDHGALVSRTDDHSVVQMLFDMGKISESEMATHPDQNRLLKSVGGEEPSVPDVEQKKLSSGDGFLLCSDGLWESVSINEMAGLFSGPISDGTTEALVLRATSQAGGKGDNVTIAVARILAEKSGFGLFLSRVIREN